MSFLSFRFHYIQFLELKPHATVRLSTHCDNDSLLKQEEKFHTREIDSSSWFRSPDHDVIMTLSDLRTRVPVKFTSQHVKAHQDDHCEYGDLSRPAQLNVLADIQATAMLDLLRDTNPSIEFYTLPACRVYLRDATGYVTSHEKRTLQNDFTEYEMRAYVQKRNNWNNCTFDSISWTAYQDTHGQRANIRDQTQS